MSLNIEYEINEMKWAQSSYFQHKTRISVLLPAVVGESTCITALGSVCLFGTGIRKHKSNWLLESISSPAGFMCHATTKMESDLTVITSFSSTDSRYETLCTVGGNGGHNLWFLSRWGRIQRRLCCECTLEQHDTRKDALQQHGCLWQVTPYHV